MKIDRYTKVVLTIIAAGIIGLNVHFFKDDLVKEAHAYVEFHEHSSYEIYDLKREVEKIVENFSHKHRSYEVYGIDSRVEDIIEDCRSRGEGARIKC